MLDPARYDEARKAAFVDLKRHPELDHDEEIWVLFTERIIVGMGGTGDTYGAAVEMERELTVEGEALTIRERVTMHGDHPISVMWGQHPTFGSDLLDGPFEIGTAARRIVVDDRFDSPLNPLMPGAAYRVTVTATSGSNKRTLTLFMLVGGTDVYLPAVRR